MKTVLTLCASLFIGVVSAQAAEPPVRYSYPDQSVWTDHLDADGNPDNPLLRLADRMFKAAKLDWTAQAYPAARMFQTLEDGTADFSILVKSPVLAKCCVVGELAVAETKLRLYRLDGAAAVLRKEDLRGKSVILVRGYSYGALKTFLSDADNHIHVEPAETHAAAFAMLRGGRAEYLLDYAGPAAEVLAAMPNMKIRHADFGDLQVFLVVSKQRKNAASLLKTLEAAMTGLDRAAIMNLPQIDQREAP